MKKTEILSKLTALGCNPRYSGKLKTFYINKGIDYTDILSIEESGFKLEGSDIVNKKQTKILLKRALRQLNIVPKPVNRTSNLDTE